MTPFFKCKGSPKVRVTKEKEDFAVRLTVTLKTAPAKMLNSNPGLSEITHSITGGSLAAQGFWMPFEAAKAMAATFCWAIRYALTPIFGLDFPDLCVDEADPCFGRMKIDARIIQQCTEKASEYRLLYTTTSRPSSATSTTSSPTTMKSSARTLRPKVSKALDAAQWCTSESEPSPIYTASPSSPKGSGELALKTPRSVKHRTSSPTSPPSFRSMLDHHHEYTEDSDDLSGSDCGDEMSSEEAPVRDNRRFRRMSVDSCVSNSEEYPPGKRQRKDYKYGTIEGANILLNFHADACAQEPARRVRAA